MYKIKYPLLFIFFTIQLLTSCSHLVKNETHSGTLPIRGGIYRDKNWKESLVFSRTSWYQEFSLKLEILNSSLAMQSPFTNWLGEAELQFLQKCSDARIVLFYLWDNTEITSAMVLNQFEKNGFNFIKLNDFNKHLIAHPDAQEKSLRVYQAYGMCRQAPAAQDINIDIPGFQTTKL